MIKKIEKGYRFIYPNGVNDIIIIFEKQGEHYIFRPCYNNFSLSTGEGGNLEKIARIMDIKDVKNPEDMSLRVLQDVLISEILPKNESLDLKLLSSCSKL